jgi:hypothetical protein
MKKPLFLCEQKERLTPSCKSFVNPFLSKHFKRSYEAAFYNKAAFLVKRGAENILFHITCFFSIINKPMPTYGK